MFTALAFGAVVLVPGAATASDGFPRTFRAMCFARFFSLRHGGARRLSGRTSLRDSVPAVRNRACCPPSVVVVMRSLPAHEARKPRHEHDVTRREHVVLLHGLWMRGFTLMSLRRRLEAPVFPSICSTTRACCRIRCRASKNCSRITAGRRAEKVHFVGHSLGGLLALQTLRHQPHFDRRTCRVSRLAVARKRRCARVVEFSWRFVPARPQCRDAPRRHRAVGRRAAGRRDRRPSSASDWALPSAV